MKVIEIKVDELPGKCDECIMCIFDAEHMADWCYAMDRHALTGERPTYCPLVVEPMTSRSQERRLNAQGWFKYPPAPERKEQ